MTGGEGRKEAGSRLRRRVGPAETTGAALGAMIGSGVYVSMGQAAGTTGGRSSSRSWSAPASPPSTASARPSSAPTTRGPGAPTSSPAAGLAANALVALSLPWQTLATVLGVAAVGLAYYVLGRPRQETLGAAHD